MTLQEFPKLFARTLAFFHHLDIFISTYFIPLIIIFMPNFHHVLHHILHGFKKERGKTVFLDGVTASPPFHTAMRPSILFVALCVATCMPYLAAGVELPFGWPSRGTWCRTELFFGLSMPNGGVVPLEDFEAFIAANVTPVFSAGYTVLNAAGYWLGSNGSVHEDSRVVLIYHNCTPANLAAIQNISAAYTERFSQDAALYTIQRETTVCTGDECYSGTTTIATAGTVLLLAVAVALLFVAVVVLTVVLVVVRHHRPRVPLSLPPAAVAPPPSVVPSAAGAGAGTAAGQAPAPGLVEPLLVP